MNTTCYKINSKIEDMYKCVDFNIGAKSNRTDMDILESEVFSQIRIQISINIYFVIRNEVQDRIYLEIYSNGRL